MTTKAQLTQYSDFNSDMSMLPWDGAQAQLPTPDIYCLNCTLSGEVEVRINIEFKRMGNKNRVRKRDAAALQAESRLGKYQGKINELLENDLANRKVNIRKLRKRDDCILHGRCGEDNETDQATGHSSEVERRSERRGFISDIGYGILGGLVTRRDDPRRDDPRRDDSRQHSSNYD